MDVIKEKVIVAIIGKWVVSILRASKNHSHYHNTIDYIFFIHTYRLASFSYHFCNCLQSFYINKSEQVFRVSWWVRGDIVDSSNYSFHQKWMNKLCLCLSMPHAQQLSTKMHARQKIMKGENIYVWNLCWLPSEDGCCCELHTAGQAGLQDLIQLHTQSPCPIRVGVGCCRCELHP